MFPLRGRLLACLARPWFLPVLAGIAFHLPSLFCAFVYDDVTLVAEHPRLGSSSFLAEIWQRDYGLEFVGEHRGFYRPAFMTLVFVLRNLFGASPLVFHLFSLAVFCLAIYLVVRVASVFDARGARVLPMVAGVLYAVHPARVETVSLVMSLPDLIVECCALGMVLLLVEPGSIGPPLHAMAVGNKARPPAGEGRPFEREADGRAAARAGVWGRLGEWRAALACGALALLASLSKESAFFIVPAVMGTAFLFALRGGVPQRQRLLSSVAAALVALVAGFLLRSMAHVHAPVPLATTARDLLVGGRADDTVLALLLALRDVVVPGPVVFWRNVVDTHVPGAACLLLLFGAAITGGWYSALRRAHLALALLVAWLGANAVSLTLLVASGYVYAQRYLAFAPVAILLCLAVRAVTARAVRRVPGGALSPRQVRLAGLFAAMYLTALGAFTLAGSATCLTPLSFFLAMQRANPADVVPLGAVAETLNKVGAVEDVEPCVREAAWLDPTHPQVPRLQNMLIQRYLADGRYPDALRCAQWAIGMYSNDADKIVLRAVALANLGQTNAARQDVEQVLARHPDHAAARQLQEQLRRREGKGLGQ